MTDQQNDQQVKSAAKNFARAMKTIVNVPKDAVVKPEPQKPDEKRKG